MAEIKYEIIETLGTVSEGNKGWKRELTLISWNERDPKYDLRDWSEDRKKMGKGITLSLTELQKLKEILNNLPDLK